MKAAEFEEKEYEAALYSQLVSHRRLWPPGQVLEKYLGFDSAIFVNDPFFWRLFGFRKPLSGIVPWNVLWPFLQKSSEQRSRLPRFRCNCFIQAKRPHVGSRLPRPASSLGPLRPFFRFSIESDQQKTLEAVAKRVHSRALFAYAAPVFFQSRDLFRHMIEGSIVANSTFPDISALAGQHAWYYNEPGACGVVNRSFAEMRMLPLEERIEALAEPHGNETEETESPTAALVALLRELQAVVTEIGTGEGNARRAYVTEQWRQLSVLQGEADVPAEVISFFGIAAFAAVFNVAWLTVL